jgi:hypothetical protein
MRYLFLALGFLFISGTASASHLAGGDLNYEYVSSNSSGHTYKLYLRLYRDSSGISSPLNATIYACSNSYSTISVSLNQQTNTGQISPTMFDCVDANIAGIGIEVYYYEGQIVLPGNAPDWVFSFSTCCRNPAIDNLLNPSSKGLYISANLNNMYGQNSSPTFVSEPVRSFCIGKKFNWKQGTVESEGDSLYFKLVSPKEGNAGTCTPTAVDFDSTYSFSQPITTAAGDPLTLDPITGIVSFTPTTIEVDVMSIAVEEWRFSSTLNSWYQIGETNRDMQFVIASTCNSIAQAGVAIDTANPLVTYDTIYNKPRIDVNCWSDTALALNFDFKLDCSTVSSDASEFGIYLPNGSPLALDSASFTCDVNNETFDLALYTDTILLNGTYIVYVKTGTDGDVITNKCGFGPSAGDTLCVINVAVPIVGPLFGPNAALLPGYTYPYTVIFPSVDSTFWSINGGTILQGQGSDTVMVQWNQVSTGTISAYRVNDYGCMDSSSLAVTTSLNLEEESINFGVYPNPNQGTFTVFHAGKELVEIRIIDVKGAIIISSRGKFKDTVDLDLSLDSGMYFMIGITSDGQILRSRFVII